MRLLLLLPTFALLAVSGYNLSAGSGLLAVNLLHLIVMVLCISVIAIILKSMFAIKYVDVAETDNETVYEELNLQHS